MGRPAMIQLPLAVGAIEILAQTDRSTLSRFFAWASTRDCLFGCPMLCCTRADPVAMQLKPQFFIAFRHNETLQRGWDRKIDSAVYLL